VVEYAMPLEANRAATGALRSTIVFQSPRISPVRLRVGVEDMLRGANEGARRRLRMERPHGLCARIAGQMSRRSGGGMTRGIISATLVVRYAMS
jgi:hypothetical protein